MEDHDDTLGGTATSAGWLDTLQTIRGRIGTMRRPNRVAVHVAAWLIRQIVMRAPGFAGAIAVSLVYVETESALDALQNSAWTAVGRSAP